MKAREAQAQAQVPASTPAPAPKLFEKGGPGGPGRPFGSLNRVRRDVREFIEDLVTDPDVQESVRLQIMAGEKGTGALQGFLGAIAHQIGKPKASVEVSVSPSLSKLLLMAREKPAGTGTSTAKEEKSR